MDMVKIFDAINFAAEKHQGQTRKASQVPYVTHPIAVSYIISSFKRSKHLNEILIASILHDVIEDTNATFEEISKRFSPMVASLVLEVSNDDEEIKRVGKLEYQMKKLSGMSSYALVIKLGDRLHNVSDNPSQKMVEDTLILMDAVERNRKLSSTHACMVSEIRSVCYKKLKAAA